MLESGIKLIFDEIDLYWVYIMLIKLYPTPPYSSLVCPTLLNSNSVNLWLFFLFIYAYIQTRDWRTQNDFAQRRRQRAEGNKHVHVTSTHLHLHRVLCTHCFHPLYYQLTSSVAFGVRHFNVTCNPIFSFIMWNFINIYFFVFYFSLFQYFIISLFYHFIITVIF